MPTTPDQPVRQLPESPYPGLRPFRTADAPLFFGRSKERLRLLEMLETYSFLAVLGSSGSGKSSLVLSGLLPDVASGKLFAPKPQEYSFTDFRPGGNPYAAFARALWTGKLKERFADPLFIEERLRRSPLGLVNLLAETQPENAARVVVVDQFEEFFRFAGLADTGAAESGGSTQPRDFLAVAGDLNEAQAFVDLLLASCRDRAAGVMVVLTMRSDFYKHCEVFTGLPEAVASRQYLTPRMDRRQLEDAIRLPLRPYHREIADDVVNWMLNDVHGEYDQLPILQHALSQMWQEAAGDNLTASHYEKIDGLRGALDGHGKRLIAKSGGDEARLARFFRSLGDFDPVTGASIRRPRTLEQLAAECGMKISEAAAIAEIFRAPEHSFLMPPPDQALGNDTVIDLSHECLLRKWNDLKGWMEDERKQGRAVVRLKERAAEFGWNGRSNANGGHLGKGEVLRMREALPAAAAIPAQWGGRYDADLPSLRRFLNREHRLAWVRTWGAVVLVVITLASISGVAVVAAKAAAAQAETAKAQAQAANAKALVAKAKALAAEADAGRAEAEAGRAEERLRAEKSEAQLSIGREQTTLAAAGASNARMAELEALVTGLTADGTPPSPELAKRLRAAGFLEEAVPAADPTIRRDYRLAVPLAIGPSREPITSVAFTGTGTAELALLIGSGSLSSYGVFSAPAGSSGEAIWSQSAGALSVSNFPESKGWVAATNAGTSFGWSEDGKKWTTVATDSADISRARWLSGKRLVLATTDGRIGIWNFSGDPPLFFKTEHSGTINDVIPNPTSTLLVSSGDGGFAILWMLVGNSLAQVELEKFGAPVRSASFSPDGLMVLLPSGERVIRLWTISGDKKPISITRRILLAHDSPVVAGSFSPDGKWIATADTRGAIYLWAADKPFPEKGDPLPAAVLRGHAARITSMAWSPDSFGLASADETGTVLLWRLNSSANAGATPISMTSHPSTVDALAWCQDGSGFATGGQDGFAKIQPTRRIMLGAFKTFGGPDQKGDATSAALIDPADATTERFKDLFRRDSPPDTPLLRRLDPQAHYLAARWDYTATSRDYLRGIEVTVLNPKTGKSVTAQPIDWGPNAATGKVADLSPGIVAALGLALDDTVEIQIPLLAARATVVSPRLSVAEKIFDWDAVRDSQGKLLVSPLPGKQGGIVIGGITDRYSPKVAYELQNLVENGRDGEAKQLAVSTIAALTDPAGEWVSNPGVEAYLRDMIFQLGTEGAAQVLQMTVGQRADGKIGAQTIAAVENAERQPAEFLQRLSLFRQKYELGHPPYDAYLPAADPAQRGEESLKYSASLIPPSAPTD